LSQLHKFFLEDQMMKKELFAGILAAFVGLSFSVRADYYVAAEFNGWASDGQLMIDKGDGTYTAKVVGLVPNARYEFKITQGTWDWTFPSDNSWFFADEAGEVTITFNTNNVSDGWLPSQNRISLSTDPGNWTIAGSFQGWDNANPATAMTPLGAGFYRLIWPLSSGTYEWKAVVTGSWDSISTDTRSINTANASLLVAPGQKEVKFYVDALTGVVGIDVDVSRSDRAHDPSPANYEQGVLISGLTLSWTVADPNNDGKVDPNLAACDVYIGSDLDPNLIYQGTVTVWDSQTLRASFPFSAAQKDQTYYWRVDSVLDDSAIRQGFVWEFRTEITRPVITADPDYQVVTAGGTAVFAVEVVSPTTPAATWYKVGNPNPLQSGGDISISPDTLTLSIADAQLADEGGYYCVVNNESGVPAVSKTALLGIRRRIAYWPFEDGNANSTIAGSPISVMYHNPTFVSEGIVGDAMKFDTDEGSADILYTDPDQASYFDICNAGMTVACWMKSSYAATWGPLVARNGEGSEGWQLRHNGFSLDRVCFTTRGTGNDDGSASNRTVYDGQWRYVVGTYDGQEKKVYIDGVVSRVYNSDDGSIARESDAAAGLIGDCPSPVALAGRVQGDPIQGLVFDDASVTACILDEVEIYNYALDATAIAQRYADIMGVAVCPAVQLYDLDGDCIVNLNDLSKLASEWLSDISVQPAF
jgi:hypothetical protein